MKSYIWAVVFAAGLVAAPEFSTAARAQSVSLSEAEVTRFLSGRTFQMNRGPATFSANGAYRFAIRGGEVVTSTWQACGSAVCTGRGWRGALSVESGTVFLTDPQGNRINMGRKR